MEGKESGGKEEEEEAEDPGSGRDEDGSVLARKVQGRGGGIKQLED